MEWNWTPLQETQMHVYQRLCPIGEYRVIELDFQLPGISIGLTSQCTTLFIAASGDQNGRGYYMVNLLRPDSKDKKGLAVDQMPFGFVFDSQNPLLSGALIQHGAWDGRTTYVAPSCWQSIIAGDLSTYSSLSIVPSVTAGKIQDLHPSSQIEAFSTLLSKLHRKDNF